MPAGKCVAITKESAPLDGLTGHRLFQSETQIKPSIFKMAEVSKSSVTQAIISEDEQGQRLDNFLLKICKGVPKSHVYRIVRSGEIRVNGKRAEASYRLQIGDVLRIPRSVSHSAKRKSLPARNSRPSCRSFMKTKPFWSWISLRGLPYTGAVVSVSGVIEALRRQRPQAHFLELAHRLDRETSGILLVGKKRSALTALHDMFREGGTSG